MKNTSLDKNYQYFLDNRTSLVKKYSGKFVVINNEQVADCFDDEQTAYSSAVEKFGLGNFLIQKCVTQKEENQAVFHSRVIFS